VYARHSRRRPDSRTRCELFICDCSPLSPQNDISSQSRISSARYRTALGIRPAPPFRALPKSLPGSLTDKIPRDKRLHASLGPASMRAPYGVHINGRRDQTVEGTERGWRARSVLTPSAVGARTSFEGGLCQKACDQSKRGPIRDHRSRCRSSQQRHSVSRHHVSCAPLPAALVDRPQQSKPILVSTTGPCAPLHAAPRVRRPKERA
jgi:hypothetical protein